MITVAGRVPMKPELRQMAIDAAIKMTHETRKEAGCLQYHFYTDVEDPNMLHVFEEWESQEILDAHFATPHMAEFVAALGEVAAGPPHVVRYVVTESAKIM
jgi:quinol monooxygenase YgiN